MSGDPNKSKVFHLANELIRSVQTLLTMLRNPKPGA
jgi:hypothetical protein